MRPAQLAWLLLLSASPVIAKPILTATCDDPTGTTVRQTGTGIEQVQDGFIDVHPVFVLDSDHRDKLLVVFGSTKPARNLGATTQADEATIISRSKEMITGVLVADTNRIVETFTLFPTKGLLFYVKQLYADINGGLPEVTTMWAKCTYG